MGKTFGVFLRTLREERQLTLRQVEERVRVSNGYLSQIERGERRVTSFKILAKLAEAYGVSMEDLLKTARQDAAGISESPDRLHPRADAILHAIEQLPDEDKHLVIDFVNFLQYRNRKRSKRVSRAQGMLEALDKAKGKA